VEFNEIMLITKFVRKGHIFQILNTGHTYTHRMHGPINAISSLTEESNLKIGFRSPF
jgi:hypothetical protein